MAKQREKVEFRYYEIPEGEPVLALLGEEWIREYGERIDCLHFHNHMEVGYCHWGVGEVVLGQERIPFSDGSIMIVPPRLPHLTASKPGTKSFWEWMYIDLENVISQSVQREILAWESILKRVQRTGYLLKGEEHQELSSLILNIMEEYRLRKPYYRESVKGLLRACTVEFLRLSDDEDRIMRTRSNTAAIAPAMDYVALHYGEEIKISSLAEACSLSESHFRRVFQEAVNMRPVDYINMIRIQKACELMKKTRKSMEEVSSAAGFASISAFNRNFKKILDTSPYQWKKSVENYEGKLLRYKIITQKGWE